MTVREQYPVTFDLDGYQALYTQYRSTLKRYSMKLSGTIAIVAGITGIIMGILWSNTENATPGQAPLSWVAVLVPLVIAITALVVTIAKKRKLQKADPTGMLRTLNDHVRNHLQHRYGAFMVGFETTGHIIQWHGEFLDTLNDSIVPPRVSILDVDRTVTIYPIRLIDGKPTLIDESAI